MSARILGNMLFVTFLNFHAQATTQNDRDRISYFSSASASTRHQNHFNTTRILNFW